MTEVEVNNKVNPFLGWAIFSTKARFLDQSLCDLAILNPLAYMIIREREIDDEYLETSTRHY